MERKPQAKMRMALVDSRLGWSNDAANLPDPQWETALRLVGPRLRVLLREAIQAQTHAAWAIFKRRIESDGVSIRMLGSRPLQYFVHLLRQRTSGAHANAEDRDLAYITYLITKHSVAVDDRLLVDASRVTRKQFPGLLFQLSKLSGHAIPAPIIKAMLAGPERQENLLEWIIGCHVPQSWAHCESEHFEDVIRAILWSLNPGDDASWSADAVIERRARATHSTMASYQDWPRRMLRYRAWLAGLLKHFPDWYPSHDLLHQLWDFREPHKFLSPMFQYSRIGNDDTCPRLLQLIEWTLHKPDDATWSFLVRQVGGQELAALLPPPPPLPQREEPPTPLLEPLPCEALREALTQSHESGWDPFYGRGLEWGSFASIFCVSVQ